VAQPAPPLLSSSALYHPTGALSRERYLTFTGASFLALLFFNYLIDHWIGSYHSKSTHSSWLLILGLSFAFHSFTFFFASSWNLRRGSDLCGRRIRRFEALIWSAPICSPILGLYHIFFLSLFSGKITRPEVPRVRHLKRKYVFGFLLFHLGFMGWKYCHQHEPRFPIDSENKIRSQVERVVIFQFEDYLPPSAKYIFLGALELRHLIQVKKEIEMGRLPSNDLIGPEQKIRGLDSAIDDFEKKKNLGVIGKILLQSYSVYFWMEARSRLHAGLSEPTELRRVILENSIKLGMFDQIFRIDHHVGNHAPAQRTLPLGAIHFTGSPEIPFMHGVEHEILRHYSHFFYEYQAGTLQRLGNEIDLYLKKYPGNKALTKQKIHLEKLVLLIQDFSHRELKPIFLGL
jgi:hypothetical protein